MDPSEFGLGSLGIGLTAPKVKAQGFFDLGDEFDLPAVSDEQQGKIASVNKGPGKRIGNNEDDRITKMKECELREETYLYWAKTLPCLQ